MADVWVSQSGAGNNSGSSQANAINGSASNGANFRTAIAAASSGDVFKVVEGTYTFVANGLTVAVPLSIIGYTSGGTESTSPLVILTGTAGTTWTINTPDDHLTTKNITFNVGIDNITIKHIDFRYFAYHIYAEASRNRDITITDCIFQKHYVGVSVHGDYHEITSANINTSTETITTASNGLTNGDRVRLGRKFSSSILPGGISEGTEYYVVGAAAGSFQISSTSGGSPVNITSGGSGTYVWYRRAEQAENSQRWTFTTCIFKNFVQCGIKRRYGCNTFTHTNCQAWGDENDWQSCTLNSTTDTFTLNSHGFAEGTALAFRATTVPTGWPVDEAGQSGIWKIRYAKNVATDTFQVSSSDGGAAITAFTSAGAGLTVHRSYSTGVGEAQTGFDSGYTSDGRGTADKNANYTNCYGGEMSQKILSATDSQNWQGDFIKNEPFTTGSINGGYAIYCADTALDCKGDWIANNFVANHCLQAYKSYSAAPQKLVLNNCIGIYCIWQGGKQNDPRILAPYGYMTANNSTFFDIAGTASAYIVKFVTLYTPAAQVTLNDCLWGFFDANSAASTAKTYSGNPATTASPAVVETRTTWYNDRGISSPGQNPNFVDNTDSNFLGASTNWNSSFYGSSRGYFYTTTPVSPSTYTVTITGVSMSKVTFT